MFEDELASARECPAALGDLVAANHTSEKLRGCRKLVLAAAWADLFTDPDEVPERDRDGAWASRIDPADGPLIASSSLEDVLPDSDHPAAPARLRRRGGPGTEGFIRPGGRGTPWIAETCPAELGLWQQQSPGSARCLIGDALDLRHRLPRLWTRIVAGEVQAWKARTVAARSRYLGLGPVTDLDRLLADQIELLSWGRFEKILDATLLHVDPVTYQQRIEDSHSRRGVWLGESAGGLRTIIVRAAQGDVAVFWAAVNLVADLLADEGDEDPVTVRRSKAVGILGNPAAALDLLNRHAGQPDPAEDPTLFLPDPTDTNPWHPESRPGWDTIPLHQPDPADPDYLAGQLPPDQEEADDELPAGEHTEPAHQRRHPAGSAPDNRRHTGRQRRAPDHHHHQDPTRQGDQPLNVTGPVATAGPPGREGTHKEQAPSGEPEPIDESAPLDERAPVEEWEPVDGWEPPVEAGEPVEEKHPSGQSRQPILPGGGLSLRPVTRAERNASRARVQIVFHLTDQAVHTRHGVVRTDAGPITTDQLRHFLTDTDANITIHPVLDPAGVAAADSYEIPPQLRTALTTRNPDSVFPYGGSSTGRTDLDHTIPYRRGGPPGQTHTGNLGPLTRTEHRAKTVGNWNVRQPSPGTYLWRSPHGWIALTTNQGTLMLGNNTYAHDLWNNAVHDIEGAA